MARYRDWFTGNAGESIIVHEFLHGHKEPRRFLLDALEAVSKPEQRVMDAAPWSARDSRMEFEVLQGTFVVQWNERLAYAAVSEVV